MALSRAGATTINSLREKIACQLCIDVAASGQDCTLTKAGSLAFLLQVVPVIKSNKPPQICLPMKPQRLNGQLPIDLARVKPSVGVGDVSKAYVVTTGSMPGLWFDLEVASFAKHTFGSILSVSKHFDRFSSRLLTYTHESGDITELKKEKVIVEYSSPNIAKPFHAGHLRSTIIGNFIANVQARLGHDVIRMNYFGNWGTQFGAVLLGFSKYGSAVALASKPLEHLLSIYTRVNKEMEESTEVREEARRHFAMLQNGDIALHQLWSKFCELSSSEYQTLYKRLGVTFDVLESESMYSQKALELVQDLLNKGIAYTSDDQTIRADIGHIGPGTAQYASLQKSDMTTLYLTRDLAAAIVRKEKLNFDKLYYVVENGQHAHFDALHQVLLRMGHTWANSLIHVKFGRVHGMSTRKGNVVLLEDILDEAKLRAVDAMRKASTTRATNVDAAADALAVSCLIVHDFKSRRLLGYDFHWDAVLQLKGATGIHLQYAHARLCSLELNCGVALSPDCQLNCLTEPEAIQLVCHLARYDEILYYAARELEPYIIVKYLFQLSHFSNSALKVLTVKEQLEDVSEARLLLFHCTRKVLADGMQLLGIQPLEAF